MIAVALNKGVRLELEWPDQNWFEQQESHLRQEDVARLAGLGSTIPAA